jgi:hypothetical protein
VTGWLILPTGAVPAAAVGQATVDSRGNVTGTEARSVGRGSADETFTGSLTINSDCTGSMTLNFFEAGQPARTSVLSIVLVDDKKEIRMGQKSLTLPNGTSVPVVITADAPPPVDLRQLTSSPSPRRRAHCCTHQLSPSLRSRPASSDPSDEYHPPFFSALS